MCHDWSGLTPEVVQRFSFVMLKPDVLLRNILGDVLTLLEEQGFNLLGFRCGRLSDRQYRLMYEEGLLWSLDVWSHNAKAYEFGPVIGCLLWSKRDLAGSPAHDLLAGMKGSALPGRLAPDTIRWRLGATSRVFNVIHIPDNLCRAWSEANAWFGAEYVCTVTRTRPIVDKVLIHRDVARHGYGLDRHAEPHASFLLVKLRLLHSIRSRTVLSSALDALISALEDYWQQWVEVLVRSPERGDPRRELASVLKNGECGYFQELTVALDALQLQDQFYKSSVQLLRVLGELDLCRETRLSMLDYAWYLLSACDVYASELEKYLVNTLFLYPTRS